MKNLFARRTAAPGRAAEVKSWLGQHLDLGEADVVTVAELACHEPDCPPVETALTVHRPDSQRRSWHIHKPLSHVEKADIVNALTDE